jgi:UDP-GlcNAc3NAcA epimerase
VSEGVYLVGDVMYDALLCNCQIAEQKSRIFEELGLERKSYFLATVHRAENTEDLGLLRSILTAFNMVSKIAPVIWPVHPRTRKVLASEVIAQVNQRFIFLEPVSYHDMLCLENGARAILTDSGGVQKEAYWLGVPCVTLRNETEWVETVESGWNALAGTDPDRIFDSATANAPSQTCSKALFGDGHSAKRIVQALFQ